MNQINQNFNNYDLNNRDVRFKANTTQSFSLPIQQQTQNQQVQLPDMYYMPENYKKTKTFKEKVKQVDVMGLVYQWLEHPLLMLGTCAGISLGIDAFDKSCNKEYEKSIIGKAAKFGDKIEKSKFIQSDGSQKVLGGIKKVWGKIKTTAMKNSVINSMFTTPSSPEWQMPKTEMLHTDYHIVSKFKELASKLQMGPDSAESKEVLTGIPKKVKHLRISDLALDKSELENLRNLYNVNSLSKMPEEEVVNRIMLQRLGKSESEIASIITKKNASEIVSKELFKKSGLTAEEFKKIMEDATGETFELVKKASKNLKGIRAFEGKIILPKVNHQPFANIASFDNVSNRAMSISEGAETKTGRFMAKFLQKIHRGFTFGGAKFGVMLFVAPLLVETMMNTKKADKNQKVGTAAEGAINAVSWVFTFPLILKAIHAIGGIQYAGMGKEKVEQYKKLINDFNIRVDNKEFTDITSYNTAKNELKTQLKGLLKVKDQSFLTKMLRGVSRFGKRDLLKIKSYNGGSRAETLLRKIPNFLKDATHAPARFLVFMAVGIPLVDKLITKCTSKIFGHAYDPYKEEEHKELKEKQEEYTMQDLRARMLEVQRKKLYPQEEISKNAIQVQQKEMPIPATMSKIANASPDSEQNMTVQLNSQNITSQDTNIPDQLAKNISVNNKSATEENAQNNNNNVLTTNQHYDTVKRDNYTYIPSPVNVLNNVNPQSQINKYIPGQTGIKLSNSFDNSGLDAALKRADRAERRAINVLAGNFGNSPES